jgi:sigma-E factor negative regulatory protein RseC
LGNNTVTHTGIIKNVQGRKVVVSIMAHSACASCDIKGACTLSEVKEKFIEVDISDNKNHKIGDNVVIEMKQSLGTWAVLFGYIFPFLLVVSALIIFTAFGLDQGLSGLLAILILAPYYLIMYLFRAILRKKFTYRLQ